MTAISSLSKDKLQVASVVAFYMIAALVMVFVNKAVLNSTPSLPILFMLNQLLMTVLLLHLSSWLFPAYVPKPPNFGIALKDREFMKQMMPLLFIDAAGLVFNALCLRGVEAAFFQIARGMTLPFTILVQSIHFRTRPPSSILICASIVTLGFILGVSPSTYQNLPSTAIPAPQALFFGFLSSFIIAIHAVLVKSSLPLLNNSAIQLAFWTQTGSAIICLVTVLLDGEAFHLYDLINGQEWDFRVFLWGSLVTGIFGFLISIAAILSVKVTSPVTHMFSSAARTVLQALLGVWFFEDVLTVGRGISLLTIMTGTLIYTYLKSKTPPPSPPSSSQMTSNGKEQDLEAGSNASEETLFLAEDVDDEEREKDKRPQQRS